MTKVKHQPADTKQPTTMSEAGRKGGLRVKEKYGQAFYADIGKKGGRALAEKRGSDYFAEIGKKGGDATLRQHGIKYYSEIGGKSDAAHRQPDTAEEEAADNMNDDAV